jgi:hypothetical protein
VCVGDPLMHAIEHDRSGLNAGYLAQFINYLHPEPNGILNGVDRGSKPFENREIHVEKRT